MKRILLSGIFVLAGVLVLSAVIAIAGNNESATVREAKSDSAARTLTSHVPIYIDGSADFSDADDDGVSNPGAAGTEGDPYIIENWDISASTAHGIYIENTDVYFIIRNCVIHYGKSNSYYGIYFNSMGNGKIENVTSYNNYYGIELSSSSNNQITNCSVYDNSYGIELWFSSNNNITNCDVYNNYAYGIYLLGASNNNITNCDVYNYAYGIYLLGASNNNITNCAVSNNDNGIFLSSSSDNNIITNCSVYNNNDGIYLYSSSNNNITNCAVYNNSWFGIFLHSSSNNQITNCAVYNNDYRGIYLSYSSNNNITNCNVYNNSWESIWLDSSSNNTLRNNVLNNNTYNFGVFGWDISYYYQDIDTSNTINGKPIYYIIEQNGLVFDGSTSIGYLELISCNNTIVKNLTFSNNGLGLSLVNTTYSTITNCNVYNNSYGIYLGFSSNNNITNCAVYNNYYYYGIYMYYSSNNNITNCTVYNSYYGIILYYSSNTEIHYCNIYNNTDYGVRSDYNTVNATNNWWGSTNGPGADGANPVNSNVLYNPWLTEPWGGGVNIPPTAYIDSITPNPVTYGQTVSFVGHGYDSDGTIVAYNWRSSIDGLLSTSASFSTSTLSVGTHTIYFKVQDNNGTWSSEVSKTLVINPSGGLTPHAPISITSNSQFTSANGVTSGSGTQTDPYIIENWAINASTADGIYIENTDVYFVIRKCMIHDGGSLYRGIYFHYNVLNGKIENCEINNNQDGIILAFSSDNHVTTSRIYNNHHHGIYITYSLSNSITSNQICNNYDCGIYIRDSSNNEIHYNNIYNNTNYGIYNYNSEAEYQVNATLNWWGSASGPSGVGPGSGDAVSSNVLYEPWLTEPYHPPSITITQPKEGLITNQNVTLVYSIDVPFTSAGALIPVNIDGPLNGTIYTSEGEYNITIIVTDGAGNTATTIVSFTIDKTPPGIAVTGVANESYYNVNVAPIIEIVDLNLNTSAVTLNGVPFVSDTTINEEGTYVLFVQATDKANNTVTKTVSFTIDKTAPVIEITGVANNTYYNVSVTPVVGIIDINLNISIITLNGQSFTSGTTVTADGSYILVVQAIDKAGNTASKTVSFAVDKTLPEIVVTGIADNAYYNISVTPVVDITDLNLNTTSVMLNSEIFINGTTVANEGNYVLYVQATDKANNVATKTLSFTIDKTKPVITITGVTDAAYYNVNVTPVITITDTYLNTTTITLNNNPFVSGTMVSAEGVYYLNVSASVENKYYLNITAIDMAGNTATKKIIFYIDKTKPVINITGVTSGSYYNTDVIPIIDVSDANINITLITLNGNPFTSGNTISTENEYILVVQATDKAGNNATKTITFTMDKTPPTISNLVPAAGTKTTDDTIVISGKTEPEAVVKINGIDVSVSSDGSFSKGITLAKGENTITITSTDIAGNTKTETIIVTKTEKKEEKGFIPGFETFLLLIVLTGYATVGIRRRKKASPPEKPAG